MIELSSSRTPRIIERVMATMLIGFGPKVAANA